MCFTKVKDLYNFDHEAKLVLAKHFSNCKKILDTDPHVDLDDDDDEIYHKNIDLMKNRINMFFETETRDKVKLQIIQPPI